MKSNPCLKTVDPSIAFSTVGIRAALYGMIALHLAHQIAHSQLRRNRHEHMDVIAQQHAMDDLHAVLRADLTADVAHTSLDITLQYFEPIFR